MRTFRKRFSRSELLQFRDWTPMVTDIIHKAQQFVSTTPRSFAATMLPGWIDFWVQVR
jgi:hypothetical protein